MEATIQSTNRAINIDINVSINVDALKANVQGAWQATWKAINVYVLQPVKQHLWLRVKGAWFMVNGVGSLPRLYRHQLCMARAVAAWCDRHSALVNWLMAIQVIAFAFYVFLFV